MTEVTVDLDDLETLVFAASAIREIEQAVQRMRRDPFVAPHLGSEALNRLAEAVRHAKRAQRNDTLVLWDAPLSGNEVLALKRIVGLHDDAPGTMGWVRVPASDKEPKLGEPMSDLDRLACKGCVRIGNPIDGVLWSGEERPAYRIDPTGFCVEVTRRGRIKLSEAGF